MILRIITSRPMVTMISNTNPNQPSTIAAVPTPLFTLPFPKSCATVAAATEAVCCHNTDTSTKIDAMKISASATCETGREGKGLTSTSEPCASVSSCQPGKVARRMKVTKARMMATILEMVVSIAIRFWAMLQCGTYSRYGNTTASLNVVATQIKFSGS